MKVHHPAQLVVGLLCLTVTRVVTVFRLIFLIVPPEKIIHLQKFLMLHTKFIVTDCVKTDDFVFHNHRGMIYEKRIIHHKE